MMDQRASFVVRQKRFLMTKEAVGPDQTPAPTRCQLTERRPHVLPERLLRITLL
jgi:hypothetical protein